MVGESGGPRQFQAESRGPGALVLGPAAATGLGRRGYPEKANGPQGHDLRV